MNFFLGRKTKNSQRKQDFGFVLCVCLKLSQECLTWKRFALAKSGTWKRRSRKKIHRISKTKTIKSVKRICVYVRWKSTLLRIPLDWAQLEPHRCCRLEEISPKQKRNEINFFPHFSRTRHSWTIKRKKRKSAQSENVLHKIAEKNI